MTTLYLLGGRVACADAPGAEACAIAGGRLVWAGSRADARARAVTGDEIRDWGAAEIRRSFLDHHTHPLWYGERHEVLDVRGVAAVEDVLHAVAARAAAHPAGGWLQIEGWRPADHAASRAALDAVTGNLATVLGALDGHALWANSAALACAGLDDSAVAPAGGAIDRDAHGRLTGVLRDTAMLPVLDARPAATAAERRTALAAAQRGFHRYGITTVHAMEGEDAYATLRDAEDDGALTLEVGFYTRFDELAAVQALRGARGDSARVRLAGTKSFLDGSLGSHSAAFCHPYSDTPDNCGLLVLTHEEMLDRLRVTAEAQLAAAVHAIGDRAVQLLCEVHAAWNPAWGAAPPMRVEHAQHVAPGDERRLAASGLVASMQPLHAPLDAPLVARSLTTHDLHTHAWATLAHAGVALRFGSDAPVVEPDVLAAIAVATDPASPHALPRDAAFAAYGSHPLRIGDRADCVVLDADRVRATLAAGAWVYDEEHAA